MLCNNLVVILIYVFIFACRHVEVRATSTPSDEEPVDLVFVQCKAAHTKAALEGAKNMFKEVSK